MYNSLSSIPLKYPPISWAIQLTPKFVIDTLNLDICLKDSQPTFVFPEYKTVFIITHI